jgi:hypothetical protein
MMLPAIALRATKGALGRAVVSGVGLLLVLGGITAASWQPRPRAHRFCPDLSGPAASADPMRAANAAPSWARGCMRRLERAKRTLVDGSPEFRRAHVRFRNWNRPDDVDGRSVWLELPPQYLARISWSSAEWGPSVYDWEEEPTPVIGSFALHRRVAHVDLTVVADDSDVRGQHFASLMQPLLDDCLMEVP